MFRKIARYYPILVVLAIFGALAIFIASAPNKPSIFNEVSTNTTPLSDQIIPEPQLEVPRKTPTVPIVTAIDSPNAEVRLADLMYGQQVRVNDGTPYFESSDLSGSGKQGVVGNRYTEVLRISGFAVIDPRTGHPVQAEAYTRDDVPVGKKAPAFVSECEIANLWVSLCTDGFETGDVGWCSILELNWQDGALDIAPEAEDKLNTAEDISILSNPHLRLFYLFDLAYAIDPDKAYDFCMKYNFYERYVWAVGSVLELCGKNTYYPERQSTPYPNDDTVDEINDWLRKYDYYLTDDSPLGKYVWSEYDASCFDNLYDQYVWADYDPYLNQLYNGMLEHPFHGRRNVLVIVTDTHERNFTGLEPCAYFDDVFILDISPEYEVDPDFKAQIETAYGPISDITEQDAYICSLKECLGAFS